MATIKFVKPSTGVEAWQGKESSIDVEVNDGAHAGVTFDLLAAVPHGGKVRLESNGSYSIPAGVTNFRIKWSKMTPPKNSWESIAFLFTNVIGASFDTGDLYNCRLYREGYVKPKA